MSWPAYRLDEVAEVVAGNPAPQEPSDFAEGGYIFVRMQDVGREHHTDCLMSSVDKVSSDAVSRYRLRLFPSGSLLIPKSGASVNLNHRAMLGCDAYIVSHLAVAIPDQGRLLPGYLYYWSLSYDPRNQAQTTSLPSLPLSLIKAAPIPVPPLPEQRRIVDLLSRAGGIVRLRREAEKKAAELIPALFLDMFGDPATNPKGWAVATIGSLTSVQTGATPPRDNAAYYSEAEIPWVKTGEVGGGVISDTEEKISRAAVAETNCKVFPVGTVLVAMYGQGQTRGRCAVLGIPAASNQACAALLPSDKICTAYLFCFLKTQYEQLRGMAHGGNQANLNLTMIKGLPIILPPLSAQQTFADTLESITSIQSQQSAATAKAQSTFDALLALAFAS